MNYTKLEEDIKSSGITLTALYQQIEMSHTGAIKFLEWGGTLLELKEHIRHTDLATLTHYLRGFGLIMGMGVSEKFREI